MLGYMHTYGLGPCSKSNTLAYNYTKLAADKGDGFGCYSLGIRYYYGDAVVKDVDKAFYYLKLAHDIKMPAAAHKLAELHSSEVLIHGKIQESLYLAIYWINLYESSYLFILRERRSDYFVEKHKHEIEYLMTKENEIVSQKIKLVKISLEICAWCKKYTKVRKCTQCRILSYCDVICQKKHWKKNHKEECKK